MADMETIGIGSTLATKDTEWLNRLADMLYEEGFYTKGIYLLKLVENANKVKVP